MVSFCVLVNRKLSKKFMLIIIQAFIDGKHLHTMIMQ